MIHAISILSPGLVGCLLSLGVIAQGEAGSKVRGRIQNPVAVPGIVTLVPRRGPLGLPGLLTSTDVIIGDATVSYIDPEFLPDDRLMVWQDAGGEVWVCQMDPDTGLMLPADGKGRYAGRAAPLLTKQNPFFDVTYNGPEFGVSRNGIAVFYCGSEQLEVMRYDLATQLLDMPVPAGTQNTRALISSKEASDAGIRVMSARLETMPGNNGVQIINEWFDDSDPEVVRAMPQFKAGTSGPQWIPGQRVIITQYPDAAGVQQVSRYDLDTEEFTQLTDTPGDKVDSFAFRAPEFPGEILFLTLNQRKWLEVYRQQGAKWVRFLRLPAPENSLLSSSGLKSAEPVIYRGQTYFTYLADGVDINRIAFASLDGRINTWISSTGQLDQFDPEGVAFDDRLFVYYYEGENAQKLHVFHRCEVQFWQATMGRKAESPCR